MAEPRAVEHALQPPTTLAEQIEAQRHRAFESVARLVEPPLPFDSVNGPVSGSSDAEHGDCTSPCRFELPIGTRAGHRRRVQLFGRFDSSLRRCSRGGPSSWRCRARA